MNAPTDWQTPLALIVVAVAAALLVRGVWKRRRAARKGCGSSGEGCGCDVKIRRR